MAGVDLVQALADARPQTHRSYPALREALPAFLDEQVKLGNLRESTGRARARLMSRRSSYLSMSTMTTPQTISNMLPTAYVIV